MSKTAVVLFNLGGPDEPSAVRPFLFNLFNDPAIIALPMPFRWLLAKFISARRAPIAGKIYEELGGASPLLPNTEAQATALELVLAKSGEFRVFIAMRYWHPFSEETVMAVKAYAPSRILLLPLYPQFSTTTSGSSFTSWSRAAMGVGLDVPTHKLCCYPTDAGFIAEVTARLRACLNEPGHETPRVLFSAHGLPKKIVDGGDPYQWQVEQTAAAVVQALGQENLDWRICYQSRVGRLEWIGPSTDAEIERAGRDGVPLVVVPIAFVSEHSETLVELDIEYAHLARRSGVPSYRRVPTVDTGAAFIDGLAGLVQRTLADPRPLCSQQGSRLCPARLGRCLHKAA